MNESLKLLSNIITFSKYARYLEEEKRRETWDEIVTRNKNMHIEKFLHLKEEIEENYKFVYDKKVLPSMRSMQFGGLPVEINPVRLYNCSAMAVNHPDVFSEVMFLLLAGAGVGVSVQKHHVEQLPVVKGTLKRTRRYLVGDSIEGWANAIKVLVDAYFYNKSKPEFDFRDIREKGAKLVTSGGKAPGFQPLSDCICNITKILDSIEPGFKMSTLQAHDIVCYLADGVLSGGIRRAALISLFSLNDEDMLRCKNGQWWEKNPQRGRANNSAVLLRHRIKKEDFDSLWNIIKENNTGEPAFIMSNDSEMLQNPCSEISLKNMQMCNLTEVNFSRIQNQKDLNECSRVASFLATLQASYTSFHFLRDEWKKNCERDALIGVSITGLANTKIYKLNFKEAAEVVKEENKRVSKVIGINPAIRCTTVKPSGTASLLLGTSSGIHAYFSNYYIRRIRVMKNESIYKFLKKNIPQLLEDDVEKPNLGAVISIPCKASKGAITRNESALDLLERVKYIFNNWVVPGHIKGNNKNNVSVTVNIKDHEWDLVKNWLWENKENYTAVSILPHDNKEYHQMPFEEITKEEYENLIKNLTNLDFNNIVEDDDQTKLSEELACSGGSCMLTNI